MEEDELFDVTSEVTVLSDRDSVLKRARATGHAILIILSGPRLGYRVLLSQNEFVIGRGAGSSLQLEEDAISRTHARVMRRGDAHYLVDAGSTNGSFVNYARISERRLEHGDEIQIGHTLLKFLSGDSIETAYHEEQQRLVRRDALTGGLNRVTFDEELEKLQKEVDANGQGFSLILFDLDHFKEVNDTHGHTAGDLLLREVAAVVERVTDRAHVFARVGGEEFAILYRGSIALAREHAEVLRAAVAELVVPYEGAEIRVTLSAGVAPALAGGTSKVLYQTVDRHLYSAKEAGRNRVVSD